MEYFEKIEDNHYQDLLWNIPEQKTGIVGVIGGNGGSFRTVVKTAEFLSATYPVKEARMILPDALKGKLPDLPGLVFASSTETGSFKDGEELKTAINALDCGILIGDLSKNAVTARAIASAVHSSAKPLLITRDAVDLVAENLTPELLLNENLTFLTSVAQLTKILGAVYYPRMLTMSQPLTQVAETLHKFTLSYGVKIITLVNGQILVAKNGLVRAVALEKTGFSPITLWGGELAAKIAAVNLFSPGKPIEATLAALFV